MGNRTERHRPLLAGLKITSSDQGGSGTLTGLATRYADGKRVLVTNLHVMARNVLNPSRTTEMYQVDSNTADDKVGRMLEWVPVRVYEDNGAEDVFADNVADIAIVELGPGVDARFEFHDPNHDDPNYDAANIRAATEDLGKV